MLRSVLENHYGNIASVLGLVVTIVTMFKAIGARKAAEGARKAASEALARIKSRLLADQFTAMIRSADEIDSACSGKEWQKAIQQCRDTRHMLARIGQNKSLLAAETESVHRMIDWLEEVQEHTRKFADKPDRKTPFPKTKLQLIDKMRVELGKILGRLENTTWEV